MEPLPPLPFPLSRFYAVVRMDPLTMIKDLGLDDAETLRETEALHPKKYLVYVNIALDLPMSTSKWCRYSVKLIANTLCPEDRKNGILPDMVIPIFPNTQCSSDTRPVIRPLQNFPFPNCFHWLESLSYIRMRRHSPFVDDSRAIRLDSEQNHATSWTFRQDFDRMAAVLSQGEPDGSSSSFPTPEDEFMNAVPDWALLDPIVREACTPIDFSEKRRRAKAHAAPQDPPKHSPPQPDLDSSTPSTSSHSLEDDGLLDEKRTKSDLDDLDKLDLSTSVAEIFTLNIFGWDPDPTFPLIPLVDLWFDLEEHITPENIPSPLEWFEEEKRVNAIIRDAFARRKAALVESISPTLSSKDESISIEDESTSTPTVDASDAQAEEQGVAAAVKLDDSISKPPQAEEEAERRRRFGFKSVEMLRTVGTRIREICMGAAYALCLNSRDDNMGTVVSP